jgi:hypothetical protein
VQGNALIVPATVAGTGCSIGTGYYDFFGLDSGKFPTDPVLTQDGTPVTSNIRVGSGVAYTPSIVLTSNGARDNTGTSGCLGGGDCKSLDNKGSPGVTPYSWRQH